MSTADLVLFNPVRNRSRGFRLLAATFVMALLRVVPVGAAESHDPLAIQEYSRRYDVAPTEADERLEMQARAAGIANALEVRLGTGFAGVWFDNSDGQFVVPVVADEDRSAVARQFEEYGLGQGDYRVALVDSTVGELEEAEGRLSESVKGLLADGRARIGLDTSINAVVVEIASNADAEQRAELRAEAAAAPVKVKIVEAEPADFDDQAAACTWNSVLRACDPPFHGGVEIHGPAICTSGFAATGNVYANTFVITAGHCLTSTAAFWAETANGYENELGHEEGHYYAQGQSDGGLIRVKDTNWWVKNWGWRGHVVVWGPAPQYSIPEPSRPIYGSASSYVGEYVCHSGRTTGSSCGTVQQLNAKVTYEDGSSLTHMTRVSGACIDKGDSGGPEYDGNYAVGILSGGQIGCVTSYYTEVKEIESIYAVHVTPW